MLIADCILIGFGVLVVYVAVVMLSPTRKCGRCKGKRVTRYWLTRRIIGCPRCRGSGRHHRLGAPLVHRFWWQSLDALRERKEN